MGGQLLQLYNSVACHRDRAVFIYPSFCHVYVSYQD